MDKPVYFFDFSKKGDITGSKDIALITNDQAVMESVYNILFTQPGERVMEPNFGCDLNRFLFDPISFGGQIDVENAIIYALSTFEPRLTSLSVTTELDIDNNSYTINIEFGIATTPDIQKIQTTLKRLR